jgi:hypothetical protein
MCVYVCVCVCVCACVCVCVCVCVPCVGHRSQTRHWRPYGGAQMELLGIKSTLKAMLHCFSVALQWCYSGVTVVLRWYQSGVPVVLQWYYSGVTVVLKWCYSGVTLPRAPPPQSSGCIPTTR